MNEDQEHDAAEREMDLCRAEVARLHDAHAADIASLTEQRNRVSDTADQLRKLLAEVLREVEAGTLRHDTPSAATRTLACVADYRRRGGLPW